MPDLSPYELWRQAAGDPVEYRRLLVEHGHLVPREPGDDGCLPCGWPGPLREDHDPEEPTDDRS